MKRNWFLRGLKFLLFIVLGAVVFSFAVMYLWNWLGPSVFAWHRITFWQALGLLLLSRILFGGFRRPGGGMHWRRRMVERWEQMTPEEREKFRGGMRGRCVRPTPAAEVPKA